jgi:mannose-1-phosphate guanylyltransferase
MKAFLLAAGLGTRLQPITLTTPKCLVNICGKPMLQWWIEIFEKHGIDEILINLHHFPDIVYQFIKNNNSQIKFNTVYEPELLGSAGTLRKNQDFINEGEDFLICYADNLTNCNLSELIDFHKKNIHPFTMTLFESSRPKECGIVSLDDENTVVSFKEKPLKPEGNLANAGIYLSNQDLFQYISGDGIIDMGFHILPKLIGKMNGWVNKGYLLDIGTIGNLRKAEKEWKLINN